jgi:hypothetical protein
MSCSGPDYLVPTVCRTVYIPVCPHNATGKDSSVRIPVASTFWTRNSHCTNYNDSYLFQVMRLPVFPTTSLRKPVFHSASSNVYCKCNTSDSSGKRTWFLSLRLSQLVSNSCGVRILHLISPRWLVQMLSPPLPVDTCPSPSRSL